jgi:hypothetical protein
VGNGGLGSERTVAGGGEPLGLREKSKDAQVAFAGYGEHFDGGGCEDAPLQTRAGYAAVEVAGDVFARQFRESGGGADAGKGGALDAQTQAAKEVVVTGQDRGHGASPSASGAQEQAQFFQSGGGIILGGVELGQSVNGVSLVALDTDTAWGSLTQERLSHPV